MKKIALLSISATFFYFANIQAQEIYQQDKTVVTASRYAQSETDVIPSITVIDRQDILNLQANNILDILSLQQGIDVARTGGQGSQTSVFMRGTNSNHTLILIDGMRASSSFSGSFSWENLPVSQIERIEIVRGSRVGYYGSDAIGGVINIITLQQDKLYARYTGGSYNTNNFDVGFGGATQNTQYSLVLSRQETDGFSSTNENNLFSFNPDDDAYENNNINLRLSYNLETSKIAINYLESRAKIDFDSFFNVGHSETTEQVARASWVGKIFKDWNTEIAIGKNKNGINTKVFSNKFDSDRVTLDWLLDKNFTNAHLGLGIGYRKEESDFIHTIVSQYSYTESRENMAVFANYRKEIIKHTVSISGRFDHNNIYGDNTSGNLEWAYGLSDNTRFNVSVGSAFHAPSLNELFSPRGQRIVFSPELGEFVTVFSFEGNPDLQPEESINYEIGLKTEMNDNHNLSFNMFYYKIDNLIAFQGATFKPVNVNESTIKGLEAVYQYSYNNLNLNINATLQDANNDETDTPLLRRPDNKLNLSVDKFFNKISVGSSIRYASKNPDFGVQVDGYTVIDLRAAYKFNEHWKLSAKIENATDKDYQIINGYNTPDLSGYLTIQWQQ